MHRQQRSIPRLIDVFNFFLPNIMFLLLAPFRLDEHRVFIALRVSIATWKGYPSAKLARRGAMHQQQASGAAIGATITTPRAALVQLGKAHAVDQIFP